MSISDTIQEYRAIRPTYERFCVKTQQLLCDLLGAEGIAFQVIEGRAKTPERFAEKPERAGKSYEAPLEDVTDLAGLRIILYYLDDVERAVAVVNREFLVDDDRSIDKA